MTTNNMNNAMESVDSIALTAKGNIGYAGIVTVSEYCGNTLLRTQTLHNTGYSLLFQFLCNCLRGDFYTASADRPCKLQVFNQNGTTITPLLNDFTLVNQLPDIQPTDSSCSISYSFMIPYSAFVSGSAGRQVNLIRLYGRDATDIDKPSAELILSGTNEITIGNNSNYNLIITWTMTLKNQ